MNSNLKNSKLSYEKRFEKVWLARGWITLTPHVIFMQQKATLHTSFWTQTLTCMSTSKGFCDDLLHRMLTLILYAFQFGILPFGTDINNTKGNLSYQRQQRKCISFFTFNSSWQLLNMFFFLCLFIHALCYIFAAVENDAPFPCHSFWQKNEALTFFPICLIFLWHSKYHLGNKLSMNQKNSTIKCYLQ